jgi:hypothetical protein
MAIVTDCDELVLVLDDELLLDREEVLLVLVCPCGWGAADALGVHISAAIISTMLVSSETLHALHRNRVVRWSARERCGLSLLPFCRGPCRVVTCPSLH